MKHNSKNNSDALSMVHIVVYKIKLYLIDVLCYMMVTKLFYFHINHKLEFYSFVEEILKDLDVSVVLFVFHIIMFGNMNNY